MSFSPALANRQRVLAAMASTAAAAGALPAIDEADPAAAEYQQLLAVLQNDQRTLRDIQSVQEKIARKRDMIDRYLPWISGWMDAAAEGRVTQDEIVVTMMIWAIDIGNWALAVDLASHVLQHGLALPERYKRTPGCLVAEEVADRAKADPAAVPGEVLGQVQLLTEGHDMPDEVRARLLRAIGLDYAAQAESFDPAAENAVAGGKPALLEAALTNLKLAVGLDAQVGVKKQIEKLEAAQRKLAAESGT